MRIHRNQPVETLPQESGKQRGADRLTFPEPAVLAHIAKIGRDQPDTAGAFFARRRGGEHQRQRQTVGIAQCCQQRHIGVLQIARKGDQAFAIGEVVPFQHAQFRAKGGRQFASQRRHFRK